MRWPDVHALSWDRRRPEAESRWRLWPPAPGLAQAHASMGGGMSEVCSISTSALFFASRPLPSAPWLRNEALLIALGSGRGPG